MNYYDIQSYANSSEVITERNQRNREEAHMKQVGILPNYKVYSNKELSQSAKESVSILCKQMFKYSPEEVEAKYA